MVRRPVLAVDDLEQPDGPGDLENIYGIVDRRLVGQLDHLFIGAEGPQGREQFDLYLHRDIIPDFPDRTALVARLTVL